MLLFLGVAGLGSAFIQCIFLISIGPEWPRKTDRKSVV